MLARCKNIQTGNVTGLHKNTEEGNPNIHINLIVATDSDVKISQDSL